MTSPSPTSVSLRSLAALGMELLSFKTTKAAEPKCGSGTKRTVEAPPNTTKRNRTCSSPHDVGKPRTIKQDSSCSGITSSATGPPAGGGGLLGIAGRAALGAAELVAPCFAALPLASADRGAWTKSCTEKMSAGAGGTPLALTLSGRMSKPLRRSTAFCAMASSANTASTIRTGRTMPPSPGSMLVLTVGSPCNCPNLESSAFAFAGNLPMFSGEVQSCGKFRIRSCGMPVE
mmetsp:Transcript_6914/g.15132  ORF Transcript_6914/g.15132 Transcript_6914/m.15132 type:complete len:232 (-) Transcript_6914:132-827(-)